MLYTQSTIILLLVKNKFILPDFALLWRLRQEHCRSFSALKSLCSDTSSVIDDLCGEGSCQSCRGSRESTGASSAVDYTGRDRPGLTGALLSDKPDKWRTTLTRWSADGKVRENLTYLGVFITPPSPQGRSHTRREGMFVYESLTAAVFGSQECLARKLISVLTLATDWLQ